MDIKGFESEFDLLFAKLGARTSWGLSRESLERELRAENPDTVRSNLESLLRIERHLGTEDSDLLNNKVRAHMLLGVWLASQVMGVPRIQWRDELFQMLNRGGMLPGDPFYSALAGEVFRFESRQLRKAIQLQLPMESPGVFGAAYCPTCLIPGDLPVNQRTAGMISQELTKKLTSLSTFYLRFHSLDYVKNGGAIIYLIDSVALIDAIRAVPGAPSLTDSREKFREFERVRDDQTFRLVKGGELSGFGLTSMVLGSRGGVIADIANRVTTRMSYCRWLDNDVLIEEREKFLVVHREVAERSDRYLELTMKTSVDEFDHWLSAEKMV